MRDGGAFGMWRWSLVMICLLTSCLTGQPGERISSPDSRPAPGITWPPQVQGFGLTIEDAKNDAIKHLAEQMAAVMRQQDPPLLAWHPTAAYVKRHVITDVGKLG